MEDIDAYRRKIFPADSDKEALEQARDMTKIPRYLRRRFHLSALCELREISI